MKKHFSDDDIFDEVDSKEYEREMESKDIKEISELEKEIEAFETWIMHADFSNKGLLQRWNIFKKRWLADSEAKDKDMKHMAKLLVDARNQRDDFRVKIKRLEKEIENQTGKLEDFIDTCNELREALSKSLTAEDEKLTTSIVKQELKPTFETCKNCGEKLVLTRWGYYSHINETECKKPEKLESKQGGGEGMKCKNCGHDEEHHRTLGGLTFCSAMESRVPNILCGCKKWEADKR